MKAVLPAIAYFLAVTLAPAAQCLQAADDKSWPQFRGQSALGVADNPDLPDTWSAKDNVAWKTDIPGRGWSSPIAWGNRAFVTTVTSEGALDESEKKRGLYFGGDRHEPPKTVHQWRVTCLALADGKVVWERIAHEGLPPESVHLKNTYASETPVTDGDRVYAYFGNLGVFCYSLDGEPLWSRALGAYKTADGMGTGSSPALYRDRLYVLHDNEDQSFLVALDSKTGAEMWRADRPEKSCWSTPYIWENQQRTEIVVSGSGTVRSYGLDGTPLWQLRDMTLHSVPTPMAGRGLLYVASGHVLSRLRPILAVRPGASGDITLAPDQTSNDFVAWCLRKAAPYNPSLLLYEGYVYVVTDLGLVYCYDAMTGGTVYAKKRLPNGRAITASPWAYNGNVYCVNEYGDTFVIKAGPDFELLRVNSLAEDEMFLATPAIAGDKLLLRSDRSVYAIQKSANVAGEAGQAH